MKKNIATKIGWRGRVLITFAMAAAALFLPTTMMLVVGMLPTLVMVIFDRTPEKARVITVGSMNLAGCMPFIMEMWQRDQSINMALTYLTEPRTIVVMYAAAGIGYMIEWAVTGLVASMAVKKAKARIEAIEKRQAELERRWGEEVTGRLKLDDDGFPVELGASKK